MHSSVLKDNNTRASRGVEVDGVKFLKQQDVREIVGAFVDKCVLVWRCAGVELLRYLGRHAHQRHSSGPAESEFGEGSDVHAVDDR